MKTNIHSAQQGAAIVSGPVVMWSVSSEKEKAEFTNSLRMSLVRDCREWMEWRGYDLIASNMPTEKYARFYFWSSGYGDGRFSMEPSNQ